MFRFNKIFYFINIAVFAIIAIVIVVGIAFAWNAPNNTPPISTNQALYVNSSGNVGIGTTNSSEALEVIGNIKMGWIMPYAGDIGSVNVNCPSGTKIIGGGCNSPAGQAIIGSRPFGEAAWACTVLAGWVDGYAICARIR